MGYIDWLRTAKTKQITPHFTLYDIGFSQTAVTYGFDNTPTPLIIKNATLLYQKVLEPLRNHYNCAVSVHCTYRCPQVNAKIGSKSTSQHIVGQAVDFNVVGHSIEEVYQYIKNNMVFDQLIQEGTWIHVSYKATGNRKQCLRMINGKYVNG